MLSLFALLGGGHLYLPQASEGRSSLVAQTVKHLLAMQGPGFDSWVRKVPWRKKWQSTLALLPGKSHGWRSLIGYSPWGHKESDTTERLHFPEGKFVSFPSG